jgi:hypothetical protein
MERRSSPAAPAVSAAVAVSLLALAAGCATRSHDTAPALVAASPQPAGATVTIAEASLVGPGFVVIHATDAEGKPLVPGSIGATPLPGGDSRNIAVALSAPVAPGDRLVAMLHTDSGQAGVYEFGTASIAEDKPVMHFGHPVTAVIELQ